MQWDNATDLILIGEVILANVFQTRKGTAARGNTWKAVAAAMQERGFDVDARAVRDRITHLKDKLVVVIMAKCDLQMYIKLKSQLDCTHPSPLKH